MYYTCIMYALLCTIYLISPGVFLALGCATTGASIFAYYGIYKHHLWWQRFWGNFDHEARKERIAVSAHKDFIYFNDLQ